MKSKSPSVVLAGLTGLFGIINLASAQVLTLTEAPSAAWSSMASSADGLKLVAVGGELLCTSSNRGANWTSHSGYGIWSSVASSADGTRLVAATHCGTIYTSSDSGSQLDVK